MDIAGSDELGAIASPRVAAPATMNAESPRGAKGLAKEKSKGLKASSKVRKVDTESVVRALKNND